MRETCYRCFWPKTLCWCASITPMETRTRFVFLMHPKEFKQEKAATGRLTHLCLAQSELHCGVAFDDDSAVQALIRDPGNFPLLLHPGRDALDLSAGRLAPAASNSDACKSCKSTGVSTRLPAAKPGPATIIGMRTESSYRLRFHHRPNFPSISP